MHCYAVTLAEGVGCRVSPSSGLPGCSHGRLLLLSKLLPAAAAAVQVGKFLAKYSQLEMFPVKLQVRAGG